MTRLPRARVVTSDGPIVGAVKELWSDATASVVECLEAALRAQEPEEPSKVPEWQRTARSTLSLAPIQRAIIPAVNDAMRRNDIRREVRDCRRSELDMADEYRVKCRIDGATFYVLVDDIVMARYERYGLAQEIARRLINEPCPRCAAAVATLPDNVVRGED